MKKIFCIFTITIIGFLKIQAQDFIVPTNYSFDQKEDYHNAEPQIKEAIGWYLNTTLVRPDSKREKVSSYIVQ